MKRFVLLLLSLAYITVMNAERVECPVEHLDEGGVKFHLENKRRPKEMLNQYYAIRCWQTILIDKDINTYSEMDIKYQSADTAQLVYFKRNAIFETFMTAFDKHYSLVLSPDMIWLLIDQGIASQINEHAEELRDRLVGFEGQKTLRIDVERDILQNEEDWPDVIQRMSDSIASNMKTPLTDLMTCDFSTTGMAELVSSQITLMESVKKYFKYELCFSGCGVPDVTLLGTPQDWEDIRSRLSGLDDLGLKWWRKELEPILDEFVNASNGKVNRRFWLDMVGRYSKERAGTGICGGGGPAEYDGWFIKLFPFCEINDGHIVRTPKTVTHNTMVCSGIKKVDLRYTITYPNFEETHYLELWAGFLGSRQDSMNCSLKPEISWMLREKGGTETFNECLTEEEYEWMAKARANGKTISYHDNGNVCLISRFKENMEDYHIAEGCHDVRIIVPSSVSIPANLGEWCRKNNITTLMVKAIMTYDQRDEILRQVPSARVEIM